jgi:hypothetical protein
MIKFTLCLLLLHGAASAQNLSPGEQKRLVDENKMLRDEIQRLKTQPAPADSRKMMDALMKGKKFQEEQNKALEELDKEE